MTEATGDVVPAATVVLLRDASDGMQVLMCRRNADAAFGGYWVFPGGRVEPGDVDAGRPDDELEAARRAAVREAREEVGLVVSPSSLVALSHWTPPDFIPRKFRTWIFLAPVDETSAEVSIDDSEIKEFAWLRPREATALRDEGELVLAPPTWVTLWWLGQTAGRADALARAATREPERFELRRVQGPDGFVLLHPGDAGYESWSIDVEGPRHRLLTYDTGWVYERDIDLAS
jgi:8-oxo-dGTP pyrophosphatase MutT (NUDIX family)